LQPSVFAKIHADSAMLVEESTHLCDGQVCI